MVPARMGEHHLPSTSKYCRKGDDSHCGRSSNLGQYVADAITVRWTTAPAGMPLLHCLTFFEAAFSIRLTAAHVAGSENMIADDLSRDRLSSFLQAVSHQVATKRNVPPQPLLDMVIRLDISQLESDVQKYFELRLADNTKKAYQAGINKFSQFCMLYSISNPLPVSQSVLCL